MGKLQRTKALCKEAYNNAIYYRWIYDNAPIEEVEEKISEDIKRQYWYYDKFLADEELKDEFIEWVMLYYEIN